MICLKEIGKWILYIGGILCAIALISFFIAISMKLNNYDANTNFIALIAIGSFIMGIIMLFLGTMNYG